LIKDNIPVIINPLTHLFNLSISSGIVPDKLKLAKVVPVYKNKCESCIPGNYRPISLLSVFDKLLEKVMYARRYSYLQAHNILYKYQFGFRKKYSTSMALIDFIEKNYQNQNDGKLCAGVYIDLLKAFDTVNHDILLYKLHNYGICGVIYDWFRNYLTNRQQYTCIGGVKSSIFCISCGVPQASVL